MDLLDHLPYDMLCCLLDAIRDVKGRVHVDTLRGTHVRAQQYVVQWVRVQMVTSFVHLKAETAHDMLGAACTAGMQRSHKRSRNCTIPCCCCCSSLVLLLLQLGMTCILRFETRTLLWLVHGPAKTEPHCSLKPLRYG